MESEENTSTHTKSPVTPTTTTKKIEHVPAVVGTTVAKGAERVGTAAVHGAEAAGKGVVHGTEAAGKVVVHGTETVGKAVVHGTEAAGHAVAKGVETAGEAVAKGGERVLHAGKKDVSRTDVNAVPVSPGATPVVSRAGHLSGAPSNPVVVPEPAPSRPGTPPVPIEPI